MSLAKSKWWPSVLLVVLVPATWLCEVDQNKGIRGESKDGAKFITCDMTAEHNVFINSVRATNGLLHSNL